MIHKKKKAMPTQKQMEVSAYRAQFPRGEKDEMKGDIAGAGFFKMQKLIDRGRMVVFSQMTREPQYMDSFGTYEEAPLTANGE